MIYHIDIQFSVKQESNSEKFDAEEVMKFLWGKYQFPIDDLNVMVRETGQVLCVDMRKEKS